MKKIIIFILISALSISLPLFAAQEPTESDMQIMLEKIKADKKLLVAANMELTETEAQRFWPVYDEYQAELDKLNGRVADLIQAYAAEYNKNTMTDDKARKMVTELISIDQAEAAIKKMFAPKLYKALPAIKVARYLQIENKIRAALRYELADAVPLVK
ncbi:MAG: hypothetical protein VB050_06590 [Geobacteraceae bacterium]|nr:hypothetical protein [Geobacteraceae bacterium]